ncbi:MAG: hypothetical protein KDA24_21210 [Deltaproteobacteria bacterium]|nr:hypothetical protein [Deltaproteobacteria bacterium]
MTKPRKKVKSLPRSGALGDAGIRLGVQYVGEPEEEIPDRVPVVPPRLDTRSPAECRELAARQKAGEELGLSDAFVNEWG